MKIATLLFTFNRSYHTKQVLTALRENKVLPQKLFVFQDGIKHKSDRDEWEKVNCLIRDIDWCDTEIVVSEYNKGLSESIISGINYVLKEYDAVIVLEDDCVPTENFMSYMTQCFLKYQNNKKVYSVSGYSWPIHLQGGTYDVYGCGRISSWGWGTWKDRWAKYNKDYELVRKMKQNEKMSRNLAMWGRDLEETLVGNVRGVCDSWAVFWALNVIMQEGICINPYESFIRNIGFDGSGVHCGVTDQGNIKCINQKREEFSLPDEIGFASETITAFAELYGSYTAANDSDNHKKKILVYGIGNFFLKNEKEINQNYYIDKFIDLYKKGYFAGKEIIKPVAIENCDYEKIVVMLQNREECMNIVHDLVQNHHVSKEKIQIGWEE